MEEDWSPRRWLAEQQQQQQGSLQKRVKISGCVGRLVRQFEELHAPEKGSQTDRPGSRRPRLSVPASFPEQVQPLSGGGYVSGVVSQLEATPRIAPNPTLLNRQRRRSVGDISDMCS